MGRQNSAFATPACSVPGITKLCLWFLWAQLTKKVCCADTLLTGAFGHEHIALDSLMTWAAQNWRADALLTGHAGQARSQCKGSDRCTGPRFAQRRFQQAAGEPCRYQACLAI